MRAVFRTVSSMGKRTDEILDLTAPADKSDGTVARWLREALARTAVEPAQPSTGTAQEPAV